MKLANYYYAGESRLNLAEVVKLWIMAGADVNETDSDGLTPLGFLTREVYTIHVESNNHLLEFDTDIIE